jgi:hypothetical protein
MEMAPMTIYMSKELDKRLRQIAKEKGVPLNDLMIVYLSFMAKPIANDQRDGHLAMAAESVTL